jgi:hypothetical protein
MLAVVGGHSEVVDTLLWVAEADRNVREQSGTNTALDYARLWGHQTIVDQLTIGRKIKKKKEMLKKKRSLGGKMESKMLLPALTTAAPWLDADDNRPSMLVFNIVQRGWRPVYV